MIIIFRASSHEEILTLADFYSILDNEFFFDRHPRDNQLEDIDKNL